MDRGFTIKCNKCGRETVITQGAEKGLRYRKINNCGISIFIMGSEPGMCFVCDCENAVIDEKD